MIFGKEILTKTLKFIAQILEKMIEINLTKTYEFKSQSYCRITNNDLQIFSSTTRISSFIVIIL